MNTAEATESFPFEFPDISANHDRLRTLFEEAPALHNGKRKDWKATSRNFMRTGRFEVAYPSMQCPVDAAARCGVPRMNAENSFENFRVESISAERCLQTVREFANMDPMIGCLILSGSPGCGKDHLAVSVLRQQGFHGIFRTQSSLLDEVRACYGAEGESRKIIRRVAECPLLILSDVGMDVSGADFPSILHQIVDHRYDHRLPFIITTNLPNARDNSVKKGGLQAFLGERLASRIAGCLFRFVTLPENDHRKTTRFREAYFSHKPSQASGLDVF